MTPGIAEMTLEERLQRGVALKLEGRYDDALNEIQAVLQDAPGYARAHRELGLVMNFTGQFEESIEELRRAVDLEPFSLDWRVELALAYSMLGFMDEAKTELETVLEADPSHSQALRHIVYFR